MQYSTEQRTTVASQVDTDALQQCVTCLGLNWYSAECFVYALSAPSCKHDCLHRPVRAEGKVLSPSVLPTFRCNCNRRLLHNSSREFVDKYAD